MSDSTILSLTTLKLVRDNINERPGIVITICADDNVYRTMLMGKLIEEARELIIAPDRSSFIEELADIAEVIEAIMDHASITTNELTMVKQVKKGFKGGFTQRKLAQIGKVDI